MLAHRARAPGRTLLQPFGVVAHHVRQQLGQRHREPATGREVVLGEIAGLDKPLAIGHANGKFEFELSGRCQRLGALPGDTAVPRA